MELEQFDAMIATWEKQYHGRYQSLVKHTFAMLLFGYFVIILQMLLLLTCIAFLVIFVIRVPSGLSIKIALLCLPIFLPMSWMLLRSLWVRTEEPKGIEIRAKDAPALFSELESIAQKSAKISFNRIILTDDFNACVVNTPRLGIFGWNRHHLVLGLPLMDSLDRDEFLAVIAHEYAHFSKDHGKLGNWLYRARVTWATTIESLSENATIFTLPLVKFIGWFWPRFNGKCFVVSRMNEYQADAFAAKCYGAESAADALIRLHVYGAWTDSEFWTKINRSIVKQDQPPTDVFHQLNAFIQDPCSAESRLLHAAFQVPTRSSDTHPSLRDRVAALLSVDAEALAIPTELHPIQCSATASLFPDSLIENMRASLNEEWRNQIKPIWEMRHKECHELLEKTAIPDESEKSQWEHLSVRASFWGVEDMKADIVTFLEKHPHHYCARMTLAIHDLDQKVPGADQRIEELLLSSAEMLEEALAALERHYLNSGNKEKILSMPKLHEFWMNKIAEADQERNSTPIKPSLGQPLCVEAERMEFEKAIRPYGPIHIVRACFMQCETYPEFPHHILLVTLKFPLLKYASEENKAEALHALLQVWNVRGSVLILNKDSAPSALIKQIEAIENSLLFQR